MFFKSKSSQALTNYAIDLYEAGQYKKAKKICRKLINADPSNYTAYINLGNIYFIEKNYAAAIEEYLKADSLKKDYYPAKINLANSYLENGDFAAAVRYAEDVLLLDSDCALAHNILGSAYLEQDRIPQALFHLLQAEKLDSKDPWIHNYLSQAYQKNNEISKALDQGWKAVLHSGGEEAHHINFGYLLYEATMENKSGEARKYASLWLEKFPFDKIAQHMGNAVKNAAGVTKANDEYLQNIFDVFAENFEEVLAGLEYKTPERIGGFLNDLYGEKNKRRLKILDAGCGTGLCGKYLKKYAGFFSLHGVDLSAGMLEQAKAKKLYNKLFHEELNAYLSAHKNCYDLIVSADVFTYFGALDSLFANLASALKKSGRVIFSVTENRYNEKDYYLHISGRFVHSFNYVKNVLENSGFRLEKTEKSMLRKEGDDEVWGYVVSACKQ